MSVRLKRQIIYTATDEQLKCPKCYEKLWATVVSLTHISRRGWIATLECFIRDLDILGLRVLLPSGQPFQFKYIFDVFPDEEGRWFSDFFACDDSGCSPQSMSPKLDRLRLLDLYCQATMASYCQQSDNERCSLTHVPLGC